MQQQIYLGAAVFYRHHAEEGWGRVCVAHHKLTVPTSLMLAQLSSPACRGLSVAAAAEAYPARLMLVLLRHASPLRSQCLA